MDANLLCPGIAVTVVALVMLLEWGLKRQFLRGIRQDLELEGHVIRWGPSGSLFYGTQKTNNSHEVFGALAIVDGYLMFRGAKTSTCNIQFPLSEIYGLDLCTITVRRRTNATRWQMSWKNVVKIHTEVRSEWSVYTFEMKKRETLCGEIQRQRDHTIPERIDKHQSSVRAHRMNQDVYGAWQEECAGELYLAPDRIVFDWRSLIEFVQIRRIEVFERGGLNSLNPFPQELVRIEYTNGDGKFQVIGFLLRGAEAWADSLSNHTSIPVKFHFGRKKKEA